MVGHVGNLLQDLQLEFRPEAINEEVGLCYDQGEAAGYLYPQRPPTSRQDCQVRVTTCRDHVIYDHVICMTQGHVTSEQRELTRELARRAHIASCASQQV